MQKQKSSISTAIPLLIIPIILYAGIVFGFQLAERKSNIPPQLCQLSPIGVPVIIDNCSISVEQHMYEPRLNITVFSGNIWRISISDMIIVLSLFFLFIEIVRSTTPNQTSTLVNHGLSLVVMMFGGGLFLVAPGFSNSTFFIIVAMAILDVIAGFIISIVSARRDSTLSMPSD